MNEVLHPKSPEGDAKLEKILIERYAELARLDGYERQALSRRKTAIRNFDAHRAPEPFSPRFGVLILAERTHFQDEHYSALDGRAKT